MYVWSFWGMNLLWWLFWVALLVVFFALATPVPRHRVRLYEDPLSILRRRYAAGEITTDEYEERRTRLLRDLSAPEPPRTAAGVPRTQRAARLSSARRLATAAHSKMQACSSHACRSQGEPVFHRSPSTRTGDLRRSRRSARWAWSDDSVCGRAPTILLIRDARGQLSSRRF